MTNNEDPQFTMRREYHVWGVENGHQCYCPVDNFEQAEEVRLNGHPELPKWKPKRRSRVRFAVAIYRETADGGVDRVGQPVYVATCEEIHRTDREIRRKQVPTGGRVA